MDIVSWTFQNESIDQEKPVRGPKVLLRTEMLTPASYISIAVTQHDPFRTKILEVRLENWSAVSATTVL